MAQMGRRTAHVGQTSQAESSTLLNGEGILPVPDAAGAWFQRQLFAERPAPWRSRQDRNGRAPVGPPSPVKNRTRSRRLVRVRSSARRNSNRPFSLLVFL